MNLEYIISISFGILVIIVTLGVVYIVLQQMPLQLEGAFNEYCLKENATVYYPVNLDCTVNHKYCNVVCTNGITMDEWLSNITIVQRFGK